MKEVFTIGFLTFIVGLISLLTIKDDIKVYYDPMIQKLSTDLQKIYPDFTKLNIVILGANDTFTENKRKIFICLRNKQNEYYDYNTLLYITLHELAHVLTSAYDNHGEQFTDTFSKLLHRAKDLGLYDHTKDMKYDYCGTKHLIKHK